MGTPENGTPPPGRPVDAVRSTLIASSLLALRALELEARYFAHLPKEHHETVRSLGVGEWLPIALAVAHYNAYDAMGLSDDAVSTICTEAARRTHGVMLRAFGGLVRHVGGLSATLLAREIPRVWERSFRGGVLSAEPLGPKELRVRVSGLGAMGASPYFRVAMTRHYEFGLALFSKKPEVRPLLATGTDIYVARLSWM